MPNKNLYTSQCLSACCLGRFRGSLESIKQPTMNKLIRHRLFFANKLIRHQLKDQENEATWMHRKFQQGSTETLKNFPLGQPLLDTHASQKQNNCTRALTHLHRDNQARISFNTLGTTSSDLEENTSSEFHEFFEGFLAIGTLGTGKITSEPETPTLGKSFEKLAERESGVTENELKFINDELVRVLAVAEAKEDSWTDSSGRNSHVSNGRISHASSITLGGKPLEISETTGNLTCPLQGFLLGSAVEFPDNVAAPKIQQRTSLGELFERHKVEEASEPRCKQTEKREECKENHKPPMSLMEKILKKKIASPRSSPTPAETKLCKILHKFQKKVHPECLTRTKKTEKSRKIWIKNIITCNAGYYKKQHIVEDESTKTFSQGAFRNDNAQQNKCGFSQTKFVAIDSDSNGSRECWIKTDADFLVLEL